MEVLWVFAGIFAALVTLFFLPESFWQAYERFRCRIFQHCPCSPCVSSDVCQVCGVTAR